jgi:transcriptional regulator with XRE-family HTH domain
MNTDLLRVVISLSGKTQRKLAARLGVSPSYFSRLVNGERRPSKKIIKRIATILKYPDPDDLINSDSKIMVAHAR